MNWLFIIILGMIPLLVQAQEVPTEACLHIQGRIINQLTHQVVAAAQLAAQTDRGRIAVGVSDHSGQFSGLLPCGTTALLIKQADYRSQTIPVQLPKNSKDQPVTVLIPLLPVDKQNSDTPYLQTEQTSYVQSDAVTADQSSGAAKQVQHNMFLITDAIQKKPLSATVCFFFTKTGAKHCLKTNADGRIQVDFKQKDIAALEVSAAGYQSYAGNMLIEQLDGRLLAHVIRLQRHLTLLTVDAPNANRCELRTKTQLKALSPVAGYKGQYVAYDLAPESVELIINYSSQRVQRTLQLRTGLNFMSVAQPNTAPTHEAVAHSETTDPKTAAVERNSSPTLHLPDSIPIIYFEQGSYQLRTDSQVVLAKVAGYLKSHPSYTLQITGHTDNVGDTQLNRTLSLYRARATATFLAGQGIPEHRLVNEGIGSSQPIMPNTTEANRVLNRRVSLKLIAAQ